MSPSSLLVQVVRVALGEFASDLGNQDKEVRTSFERMKFSDRKNEVLTPATNMRSNDGDCGFSLFALSVLNHGI